ncbi:MAG: class I SAM-dependent methyltransferase [Burkholderiales bacterium]
MDLRQKFRRLTGAIARRVRASPSGARLNILEAYVRTAPTPQNALDIFRGEWSSKLPGPLEGLNAGPLGLFDDDRLKWFVSEIGGVDGKSVLELGPFEGGHTYMLEKMGAAEILAIEANSRAYLKCLIVKELLELRRARFLCGDFVEYLRQPGPNFDVCLASGVLYHMRNPAELIALLAKRCKRGLFMWTHYYDAAVIKANRTLAVKFAENRPAEHEGFRHTLFRYKYQKALAWAGFCGGSVPESAWMPREDILACLNHFGFTEVRISFDTPDHPNGPAFAIVATRNRWSA